MDDERNIDDIDDDHPAIKWAFLEGYKACCGGEGQRAEVALEEWFAGSVPITEGPDAEE
jgi:hypothetical protein